MLKTTWLHTCTTAAPSAWTDLPQVQLVTSPSSGPDRVIERTAEADSEGRRGGIGSAEIEEGLCGALAQLHAEFCHSKARHAAAALPTMVQEAGDS